MDKIYDSDEIGSKISSIESEIDKLISSLNNIEEDINFIRKKENYADFEKLMNILNLEINPSVSRFIKILDVMEIL